LVGVTVFVGVFVDVFVGVGVGVGVGHGPSNELVIPPFSVAPTQFISKVGFDIG